jgi:hypothetical protein
MEEEKLYFALLTINNDSIPRIGDRLFNNEPEIKAWFDEQVGIFNALEAKKLERENDAGRSYEIKPVPFKLIGMVEAKVTMFEKDQANQ